MTTRCLVTGASGFIGGALVRRLVADGHPVDCLVRASSDTTALAKLGVGLRVADLSDAGSLAGVADGCKHVIHCAALVSDWAGVDEICATNVAGTRALAEAAAAAGVQRFIQISSTDVYGHPGMPQLAEDHAPAGFSNWYAESKLRAERELLAVAAARGLASVILRPATVYGPGSREVVLEIARAINGKNMLLIGGGRADAGLCYIDNLVDAIVLALRHPAAPGQAFNVTDGVAVSWRRLVDDLADGLGCPRPRWSVPYRLAAGLGTALELGYRGLHRATGLSTRPLLSRQAVQVLGVDQTFANARLRQRLGWEPRVGYAEGLAATLEWLRGQAL